jgi:hypothetical protein
MQSREQCAQVKAVESDSWNPGTAHYLALNGGKCIKCNFICNLDASWMRGCSYSLQGKGIQ